jgi:RNA polymerase sigma-70 factor (ECF subfamily)
LQGRATIEAERHAVERAALTAAMDRHADGDAEAFSEIYDLLAPRLHAFFVRQTRDSGRAEDLVQQTLLQMHRARQTFVRGSDVIPWAFAIGRRLCIDAQRRRRKEVLFDSAEDARAALESGVSRDANPDEVAEARQISARVCAELERLPEAQRAAYQLVRDGGLSVADAALVLGTTTAAVKQRVYRVYEALREVLGIGEGVGAKRSDR